MIFTELILENFGVYAGRNSINLKTENNNTINPIILFGGMNGGGKTTLMDAIRLALYGHRAQCSARGNLSYSDFLNQSINNQIPLGEIAKIELSFEHIYENHWQEFTIIRAWEKNSPEGKDSLTIIREKDYDHQLEENWDEYIEAVLPLGISNLFLFDGEQVKELAELDTPPQPVVDAINNLLGLELSEKLSADLEVLLNKKQKSLADKEQLKTVEEMEEQNANKIEEQDNTKKQLAVLQKDLQKKQKERDRIAVKFRQEGGKIASEREYLESQIKLLHTNLEKERETLRNISESSLPLLLISDLLSSSTWQGKQEVKLQKFQQAKDIIEERDRKLLSYLATTNFSEDVLSKIEFFISQENKVLVDSLQSHAYAYLDITEDELQQLISFQNDRLPFTQEQSQEALETVKNLQAELDDLEKQLQFAPSPEEYQKLSDAVKKAEQEVRQAQQAYDTAKDKIQFLEKEIERITKEIKRILKNFTEQAARRLNEEHIINSVIRVQQTLKTFKEKLTLKKLNKLENEVTECFRYLLHKSNLVNRVVIETETYRITLYDPQGKLLPKQRLSAGEKQLLAIAFLWSLARVSGKNLPVAIDTPLGRLDSSHRTNLIERYFPSASHQVILLSTDTEIGQEEIKILREQEAIAREYLLQYNHQERQTKIVEGYFW